MHSYRVVETSRDWREPGRRGMHEADYLREALRDDRPDALRRAHLRMSGDLREAAHRAAGAAWAREARARALRRASDTAEARGEALRALRLTCDALDEETAAHLRRADAATLTAAALSCERAA